MPTFILANVMVDAEPFIVFVYRLNYPLHGYLHTFLLAFFVGLLAGYVMFLLERFLHPLYKLFLLVPNGKLNLKSFFLAGASGAMLHVLFDSPLYGDIEPLYPIATNPLYNPSMFSEVYGLCVWLGAFGIIYYIGLLVLLARKKLSR